MTTNALEVEASGGGGGDDIEDEPLVFEESAYRYLIYFGNDPDYGDNQKDLNGLIIALFTLVLQLLLYALLIAEGATLVQQATTVPVMVGKVAAAKTGEGFCIGQVQNKFICTLDGPANTGYAILAFILLAVFLIPDVLGCIRIFLTLKSFWARFGGVIIFCNVLVAAYAGCLFAYQGVETGSGYDAIMNTVGVLFIHDIDDKIYEAVNQINLKRCSCKGDIWQRFARVAAMSLCVGFFIAFGVFVLATLGVDVDRSFSSDSKANGDYWSDAESYWYSEFASEYNYSLETWDSDSSLLDSNFTR